MKEWMNIWMMMNRMMMNDDNEWYNEWWIDNKMKWIDEWWIYEWMMNMNDDEWWNDNNEWYNE